MKRGGPLKRRSPLKAKKGLKQGGPLKRTSRRNLRVRGEVFDDREQRLAWIRDVLAKAPRNASGHPICPVCRKRPSGSNRLQGHHIISKQFLKRYVRGLRLPAEEAIKLLARLLWDARNGLPVCTLCHDKHTTGKQRIPLRLIDAQAHQFAREVLADFTLERYYDTAA